jgi:hypothetical protein
MGAKLRSPRLSELFSMRLSQGEPLTEPAESLCRRALAYIEILESELVSARDELEALQRDLLLSGYFVENFEPERAAVFVSGLDPVFARLIATAEKAARRTGASRAAMKKHHSPDTTDPKALAKREVRALWEEWQKSPMRYKGNAAFARDMLDKFDALRSQPVIEEWARTWKREPSLRAE